MSLNWPVAEFFATGLAIGEKTGTLIQCNKEGQRQTVMVHAEANAYIKGYKLLERLGAGSYGAVYRAYQSTVQREVAIKIILPRFANHPDFIRRFEAEAKLIARLEHPHITPLYDYWRDPEGAYLVMRLLRGGSLRDSLSEGPFSPPQAVEILDQVAAALEYAHRNQIIHGDLKPSNILLDEDGNAYLSDFGIARDLNSPVYTAVETVSPSPEYLVPEQARSESATPRTDIYSLGVMLYELLSGQHPFPALTPVERMYKHLDEPLPPITNLPEHLCEATNRIIQKATAKNPTQRYADVLAMAQAFRDAISTQENRAEIDVETLTMREQEVLQLIVEGRSNREIAQELFIAVSTVKWYVNQIYKKLQVRSRVQAIVRARELALIVDDHFLLASKPVGGLVSFSASEPQNPYKGLQAFNTNDADDFFGRESVVTRLLMRLRENHARARFLAVVGPSGSGKSSLLKAGLIPALWRGELPGSRRWFVVDMVPGQHPLDELEVTLLRIAADQSENIRAHLDRDDRGLLRAAGLILPNDGSELILLVDQFEELFTLVEDNAERSQFLSLLHRAVLADRSRVRVIIALRADFYDRPLQIPDFGELVRSRLETVLPMSADELERAITRPAARTGVSFEPGLVAEIITDIHYQPGALPLLQYALTELFQRRDGMTLTHTAYDALGRAVGALAHRADKIYLEQELDGRTLIRQMFLRLVSLGEGSEDTRRRVARSELMGLTDNTDLAEEIIDTFAGRRLLSLDAHPASRSPTVELAHEAILREWDRLRSWITEYRDDLRQQRLIARAANEWSASSEDSSYLLNGTRLEQSKAWAEQTQLVLTPDEKRFITVSLEQHEQRVNDEQARQQRARILEKRSRRVLQMLVIVLAVATLVGVALTLFAFEREQRAQRARNSAEQEAAINRSLVLAANAREEYEGGNTDLALRMALEAIHTDVPPADVRQTLATIALGTGTRTVLNDHSADVRAVSFSPDGKWLLTVGCEEPVSDHDACPDGALSLWDLSTDTLVGHFTGHTNWIDAVAFEPATAAQTALTAVSASADGTLIRWNVTTGEPLHQFEGHDDAVTCFAISPDGQWLLSGAADGALILWDIMTGEIVRRMRVHTDRINSITFSADGLTAISASNDTTIIQWDLDSDSDTFGHPLQQFEGHMRKVHAAAFALGGSAIVSVSEDMSLRLWDIETGEETRQRSIGATPGFMVMSPDGKTALYQLGNFVVLWDIERWWQERILNDHRAELSAAAFSQDGTHVATASMDSEVRIWNIAGQEETSRFEFGLPSTAVTVVPNGDRVLAGLWSGNVQVLDLTSGDLVGVLAGQGFSVSPGALDVSQDGHYVLVGAGDVASSSGGTSLILWDLDQFQQAQQFVGNATYVRAVAISPDARFILGGSQNWHEEDDYDLDGDLLMWDHETGKILHRFETVKDYTELSFSVNGDTILASSAYSGLTQLWEVKTGQLIAVFPEQTGLVLDAVFGPAEESIITATNAGTITQWDINTQEPIRRFIGHEGLVWGLAISPDQHYLASGSADGSVILWDLATGEQLRQFEGHLDWVFDVAFSPDGHSVWSASADGTVREWQVAGWDSDQLVSWIETNRYVRDFTCAERAQYVIEPLCD